MPITLPDDKVIITVAQTGALVTKQMNPNLPEQPDEIAESAYACYNEGAAICHIHGRDKQGHNTSDIEVFKAIHKGIRGKCNIILQDSTGGGPNLTQEERINCLNAGPEMASLNMGSLMRVSGQYAGVPWSNMPHEIETYVTRMKEVGVKPEMEVYSHAMFRDVTDVIKKGLVDKPYYVNIVLGMRYQGACDATPKTLLSMIDFLPEDTIFNCTAVGSAQLPLTTMAMLMGGCVRVGLEDNIYYGKGEFATNAHLVARTVRIAGELGKEPATPDEARHILGLKTLSG
ncbi:MAG: 3-keto-5-aminohexanoate cleavage protein [Deltaproteobacteria bacterium]|nr:MAG: 3-keto-5-aminohexanoate cleavage protein [Deltaproteobacteria bacterium]